MSDQIKGASPALVAALSDYGAVSGAVIDQQFIRAGYFSVQAEIDFIGHVYGPHAYAADLEAHSSLDAFSRMRALADEIQARVATALVSSKQQVDEVWASVLDDPRLPSFLKRDVLRSLSNERYEALIAPHVPALKQALLEDQLAVCRLYTEPARFLFDKERIDLRKEVFNASMTDAYGALGFEVMKRKQKVNIYMKQLSSSYSVVIEPDVKTLSGDYGLRQQHLSPLIYWPLITYDRSCYLTSLNGDSRYLHLNSGPRCIASERTSRYDSTLSLEAMVRADALRYEIAVAPFEQIVKQLDS